VRSRLRASTRFVGSVLAVTGVLLIVDGAVTLAWQEPISALRAARAQAGLERELDARERQYVAQTRAGRRAGFVDTAERYRRTLLRGDAVGRIDLPTVRRSYAVVEGTDAATLRRGPGHYPDTALPGEGRTVAVAGHRTTYLAPFRTLDDLQRGDQIVLRMPYGRFVYRVQRTRIVPPTATWVIRDTGREQLVLTACHPLYSAEQRIVVFAAR
jgi:sortase A